MKDDTGRLSKAHICLVMSDNDSRQVVTHVGEVEIDCRMEVLL